MAWTENTLEQTSIHEAGHAIARSLLGIPYSRVEVLGPNDARVVSGGDATAEWLPELPPEYAVTDAMNVEFDVRHRGELFNFCVSIAAGPVAQMRHANHKPTGHLDQLSSFGGPADASQIQRYALVLAATERDTVRGTVEKKAEIIAEVLAAADSLLDGHHEWIEQVATNVKEMKILTRDEVDGLRPSSAGG